MIVILNIVLKQVLQVLVRFEKHWTQSEQESAYAVLAFVSQLLNSVLVLLLVNARSSASATINASLSSNQKTSWWVGVTQPDCMCWEWRAVCCLLFKRIMPDKMVSVTTGTTIDSVGGEAYLGKPAAVQELLFVAAHLSTLCATCW